MATTTGSEYDHITISDGTNQTVHYLKDTAARTNVGDIKNVSGIYDGLTNLGEYTLSASDLEQGQWSYTAKVDSTTRARSKVLIPVRSGMVVTYANTTLDTYFNVWGTDVPSSSSQTPVQSIGWKTDGNGAFTISANGYMSFIIRNHSNTSAAVSPADYNSVVTIATTKTMQNKSSYDFVCDTSANLSAQSSGMIYPVWESGGINTATGEDNLASSGKAIRTNFIPVSPRSVVHIYGVDEITSAGVFASCAILKYTAAKGFIGYTYAFGSSMDTNKDIPLPTGNVAYIRIVLNSANLISDDSSKSLLSFEAESLIRPLSYKWEHHGVGEIDLDFSLAISQSDVSGVIPNADKTSTYLYPIPKDGMNLSFVQDETYSGVETWLIFYKINSNGNIVIADDYEKDFGSLRSTSRIHYGYFPYKEGVYFTLVYNPQRYDAGNLRTLHLTTGHITDNGGRMPNLQPATIAGRRTEESYLRQYTYAAWWNYWGWVTEDSSDTVNPLYYNGLSSYGKNYCSIMPLDAVKSITVAPPYSMIARIYKINNDEKSAMLMDEIYGAVMYTADAITPGTFISGINYIDLTRYDYEGIVLIGITTPFDMSLVDGTIKTTKGEMGMLNKYEDVYNSVFVEWKPGVQVTYDSGIPAIAAKNLKTIRNTMSFLDMKTSLSDGGYGNWNMTNKIAVPVPYGDCRGWWYNGTNVFNGPHMHVNPKSYITASKNRHSRVYVPTHPSVSYNRTNNLYGSVCSSTASTVCGFQVGSETFSYCSELVDNFEYRDVEGIESLRPGDLFASGTFMPDPEAERGSYGHVVYITEKVSINGEVWCVNAFEGSQPWTRYRTFVNYGAYKGYTCSRVHQGNNNDINIFDYYSWQSYINNREYMKIARPDQSLLHTIRDAYGPYDVQDYTVTEIMCDRGTDSVYCIGEYMTLTVTDGTTSVDLYCNGSKVKTVNLTQYTSETYDDGKVYTVTGMFDAAGYYEIKVGSTTKESFFVPAERHASVTSDQANNTITIYFDPDETNDKVVAVAFEYWNDSDGIGRPVYYWQDIDATTIVQDGHCAYTAEYSPEFCDNVTRTPISASILRRTPYGTYQVKKFLYASVNYMVRQRAGLMLSYEDA